MPTSALNPEPSNQLNFRQAAVYLDVPEKNLENFIKAGEIPCGRKGRNRMLFKTDLDIWKLRRQTRTVSLDKSDYIACVNFSIKSLYSGFAMANFSSQTQRDAGQYVSNSVQGKLAEIAVKKFLAMNFNTEIELDFDIRGVIVGQDIVEIKRNRVVNPPKRRVGIKATKERNMFLAVPKNEFILPDRSSDVYILVRVALPKDHFLRFTKSFPDLNTVKDLIPELENVTAEVTGFAYHSDLQGPVEQILGKKLQSPNYYCLTGSLRKSDEEWKALIESL